jgi:hypothetical protein
MRYVGKKQELAKPVLSHEEGGDGCPECGHPWAAHYDADGNPRLCVLAIGGGPGHACCCRAAFLYGKEDEEAHHA